MTKKQKAKTLVAIGEALFHEKWKKPMSELLKQDRYKISAYEKGTLEVPDEQFFELQHALLEKIDKLNDLSRTTNNYLRNLSGYGKLKSKEDKKS